MSKEAFRRHSIAANTVAGPVHKLAANTYKQLTTAAKEFHKYSIAIDESTCRSDTAFCAAFTRGIDEQAYITKELQGLIPMKGTVAERDVLLELEKWVDQAGVDWFKLGFNCHR